MFEKQTVFFLINLEKFGFPCFSIDWIAYLFRFFLCFQNFDGEQLRKTGRNTKQRKLYARNSIYGVPFLLCSIPFTPDCWSASNSFPEIHKAVYAGILFLFGNFSLICEKILLWNRIHSITILYHENNFLWCCAWGDRKCPCNTIKERFYNSTGLWTVSGVFPDNGFF